MSLTPEEIAASQIRREDLAGMSPDAVRQALHDGRLDEILGRQRFQAVPQYTRAGLAHLTPEQIVAAHRNGELDDLIKNGRST